MCIFKCIRNNIYMPGLPPKPHRGPICFDCQYESSPFDCTKITVCETGEVCNINKMHVIRNVDINILQKNKDFYITQCN